ncbi:hypothetical protein Vretimale_8343 [Volvox reticuliferus]|uniref:USP domain-containing protein n=1 Tax=Volvox reticuliferus TaxID=1737510 RepID=A0A8J4CJ93_9CHLO|nr:hypothetical protein Vretifemale_11719 [Volvox reticuliferus]GIM03604.1 hypothetical protein Vretimale_8343 [Volvox reticuliferus]
MVNKKGKGAKTKGSKPSVKKPQQENTKDLTQQSPQERVTLVRPLWETLAQEERIKLLSIELDSVRARAKQLAEAARQQAVADAPEGEPLDPALLELEPSIEDVLDEGIKRLQEKGTWKLWQWPADNAALYDAESFRQHITEKHIREELRRLLPRDEGRAIEKPAEAAFRQRMLDLLSKVQQSSSANSLRPSAAGASGEDGATRPYRRRGDPGSHLRDANIELLSVLLEALAKENDNLYHSLLTPITTYVMEILPEGHRETTKLELSFEDLENLLPDDVSRIVEWLTEKVDALSTKLKPEPKEDEEEEEESMGDVDLWSLSEENNSLTVNAKWLQHLQDRLLGEDGHPRRAKPGEDPGHNGLVLEWVYGSIVSTAEKARDGAKRCLGMSPPTAVDAHMLLVRALEEQLSWETRAKQCKDLLSEMLKSRLEAAELTRQGYDLRPQPKRDLPGMGGEVGQSSPAPLLLEDGTSSLGMCAGMESKPLPDELILFMLRREALLTRAKLHFLIFEHLTQEKELRILKQALRQGEPEFERLKRELDEVKHQPRGMEGTYRSAAEMERHRHQLDVQTAFREQGARLQATYDKKQKAEYDMAKRETEIKQLQGWKGTVENLVDKFHELTACRNERALAAGIGTESFLLKDITEADADLEAASGSLTPQQHIQLTKMRNHFFKDVRKQLYGDADDRTFFDNLKTALKTIERRLEDSSVALQHLEMQLINVACDDPGAIIGTQLALPLLQERLDQRGLEYAAQRAKLAEDEVLRMELLAAEREAAERERKKAAKAKKNEKVKSEKERLAAERQAKEDAERAARQEAERERAIRNEEERRKRVEAMEALRKAEEAAMELRRKELLSDENGYWRQRMIMEERLSGMTAANGGTDRNNASAMPSPDLLDEPDRYRSSSPEDIRRDDDGFVIENRRRRHKDTRDQDEEVAAPVQTGPGTGTVAGGGRAHLRSGSRDRMGPRDGAAQRERGEHPPHRDRDSRRHQGSTGALQHRSGSREGGGRQSSQGGSSGQQPQRLPSAPAAALAPAPVTPAAACPALPAASPPLQISESPDFTEPSTAASPELIAATAAVASSADSMEQQADPTSAGPSPAVASAQASNEATGTPVAGGSLTSPNSAAVPDDAILFGDIAVIPLAAGSTVASTQAKPAAPQLIIPCPISIVANERGQLLQPQNVAEYLQAQGPPAGMQQQQQTQSQLTPQQQLPGGPNTAAPHHAQQLHLPAQQPPQPQQQSEPGSSAGSGVVMVPPAQPAPLGTLPTGQVVHAIGHLPPGGLPGALPGIVPPMMAHMAPPGSAGPPGPGHPRPLGPAPGLPHPPYMHVNGAIPVPMPANAGTMPPMTGVLPKQMSGQQMPPPPGPVLVSIAAPPGARPPVGGPGMPAGPPPPHSIAGPPPGPQQGMQVPAPAPPQQAGTMARPPAPMPGMPGPPGAPTGIVQLPHPPGPGQPQHGQPPGAGQRSAGGHQGQPVMIAPMQFPGPIPGGGMQMAHGQPTTGPMGHVPPHLYVFSPPTPGLVPPPGATTQLQPHPHPHMLQIVPSGMPMPMGPPPPLHMQPPPQQSQQPTAGQGAPGVLPIGTQPPPPPKSPSANAGTKPSSSTLNANARSFVPAGKVTAASAGAAAGAAGGQTAQPQSQGGVGAGTAGISQQQQHAGPRGYQRHSSGLADGTGSTSVVPQQGQPQAGSYQRAGLNGPFVGSSQPPASGGSQYGRRDRRDGLRGGPAPAPRKGPGIGPHGVMASQADMTGGPPLAPHPHAGPHPPLAMIGPGGPVMMVMGPAGPVQMPIHTSHVSHGPGMESTDGGSAVSSAGQASDGSADDSGRPAAADASGLQTAAMQGMAGGAASHPPLTGPGPGPGPQHPMLPPPPPGMAPPGSRVMLTWGPGMPGPVQVPMMPVMPMAPMAMPVHMVQAAGGPVQGPNGGPVQKNGLAAESVRAPQSAQPQTAAAAVEADREGAGSGDDSAAAATATAPDTKTNDGGHAEAAWQGNSLQLHQQVQPAIVEDSEQRTVSAGSNDDEQVVGHAASTSTLQTVSVVAKSDPTTSQTPAVRSNEDLIGPTVASQSNGTGHHQQRQQQQQRAMATAAGSSPPSLQGRAASSVQMGPAPAASVPSWSSVAARREGSTASSTSVHSLDPFPSLVPSAASTSSACGSEAPPTSASGPSLSGLSWKAKLQQNSTGASAASASAGHGGGTSGGHKSPISMPNGLSGGNSPPVVVRGSSPHGTLNGVVLASSLSDSAIANSSSGGGGSNNGSLVAAVAAPPQRPPGNRPTGSTLLSGAPTQLLGSLSLSPPGASSGVGIVYHPGVSGQQQNLQYVRGLQNLGGQHNCFLNVIIQSLWHLRSFREAVLQLNVDEVAARGAAVADITVLRALVGVFRAMASPLASASSGPLPTPAVSPSWVVSPLELREALSVLETGQAVVRLDLSEMHDAFEVLLVLLTCMHRAEAGSGASQGQDPQLPRRVRGREIATATAAGLATNNVAANGLCHSMLLAAVPTGYAAAVAGKALKAAVPTDSATAVPSTAAHSLFGIEVQVPCVGDEDTTSCISNGCAGGIACRDRQQQQYHRTRCELAGGSVAAIELPTPAAALQLPHSIHVGNRQSADDTLTMEVEVYTKYFHLVHALALRKAFSALDGSDSGAYFEDVLCAAEAAGAGVAGGQLVLPAANGRRSVAAGVGNGHGLAPSWAPGATAAAHPLATLLRFPTVFTLAIVWESLQAPLDALRGTLEALGPRVDLALLFRCTGPAPGGTHPPTAPCDLRSVICYFGHHYLVFALSEELGLWLMIDDANIQLVGHWSDVLKAMCSKRLQPSLLFYEAAGRGRQA